MAKGDLVLVPSKPDEPASVHRCRYCTDDNLEISMKKDIRDVFVVLAGGVVILLIYALHTIST